MQGRHDDQMQQYIHDSYLYTYYIHGHTQC